MSEKKPLIKLSDEIKEKSRQRKLKFSKIARQLHLSAATFRTWIQRNKYPEETLIRIAEFFGWDYATLDENYVFERTDLRKKTTVAERERKLTEEAQFLREGLVTLDQRIKFLSRMQLKFEQDLHRLFRLLSKNDVVVYCSLDDIPFEMLGGMKKLKDTVQEAIKRGAHFIYLYPETKMLNLVSGAVTLPHPEKFTETFETYVQDLVVSEGPQQLSLKRVETQVHSVAVSSPAFMVPKHSYRLFQPADDPSQYRVFAHLPTGDSLTESAIHMPLAHYVSEQFYKFVRFALRNDPDLRKLI